MHKCTVRLTPDTFFPEAKDRNLWDDVEFDSGGIASFVVCFFVSQYVKLRYFIPLKGTDLKGFQKENPDPIKDVGLKGQVITGEDTDTENDLIRYSNYISGAGSTFGGFMAELPGDIVDLTDGTNIIIVDYVL